MSDEKLRVRYEHCPNCGGIEVRNILRRAPVRSLDVFVECANCRGFVARYEVQRYTSSKSYEDLLTRLGSSGGESARRIMEVMSAFDDDVATQFKQVQELVQSSEDPSKIEEIITEDLERP